MEMSKLRYAAPELEELEINHFLLADIAKEAPSVKGQEVPGLDPEESLVI